MNRNITVLINILILTIIIIIIVAVVDDNAEIGVYTVSQLGENKWHEIPRKIMFISQHRVG